MRRPLLLRSPYRHCAAPISPHSPKSVPAAKVTGTNISDYVEKSSSGYSLFLAAPGFAQEVCTPPSTPPLNHSDFQPQSATTNSSTPRSLSPREYIAPSPLLLLPPDILLHLVPHLCYSSHLALRLSHPYFYHSSLLRTDVTKRVQFLCEAKFQGLLAPENCGNVRLLTDRMFLRNRSVARCIRKQWKGSSRKHHNSFWSNHISENWRGFEDLQKWEQCIVVGLLVGTVLAIVLKYCGA